MAKPRKKKPADGKPSSMTKKMVTMPVIMSRRLAVLADWQGRSQSAIVCELLRPVLADVAVTGGPQRPQTAELSPPLKVADADAA